jgi:protein-disulfide isomerase
VPADSPFKGPKDAKVTIVEFSDFQCPFCSRVEIVTKDKQGNDVQPSLPQVLEKYKDSVKVVFRHNPLSSIHPDAHLASQASMAANEQGKFWEFHHKLFENQKALKRPDLEKYATELGLDMAKFKAALDSGKYKAKVDADQADSLKFGSPSTPGFFVNGRYIRGAATLDQFSKIIDEEIKKADELIAKGTPLADVYAKLTEKGLEKATGPAPRPRLDPNAVYKIPVDATDPAKGSADALVTIVEYSDFQCPFCSRVAVPYVDPRTQTEVKPALPDVLAKYGSKVRVVFKQYPLVSIHPDAFLAGEASLAAHEQGKFWEFHDKIFANQKAIKRPDLEKYATELGLDMAKFKAALDTGKFKPVVDAQMKQGQAIGVPGTPTFFINGKSFNQALTVDGFSAAIDAALKDAEALTKTGVAPKDVYAKLTEKGATAPVYLPAADGAAAPGAAPGAPKVIQLPQVAPGQPIVIQGGGGKDPVITTPGAAPAPGGAKPAPAPVPAPK